MNTSRRFVAGVLWAAVLVLTAPAARAANLVDLGTLGGNSSAALDINDAGQVVGWADTATVPHAFLYSGGTMFDLTPMETKESRAVAINSSGQILLNVASYGYQHAFLYSGGLLTDLGTADGVGVHAEVMNDSGDIAGTISYADGTMRPFLYSEGVMTPIGPKRVYLRVNDINSSGQVVGVAYGYPGVLESRGFVYGDGVLTYLGTLGGDASFAWAINDAGRVTGHSSTTGNVSSHAFLYSSGVMTDIGIFDRPSVSTGYLINNVGQVGVAKYNRSAHGMLYDAGRMTDLGDYGADGGVPAAMNEAGLVVVDTSGDTAFTDRQAFLYNGGATTELCPRGEVGCTGVGINEAGQVIGYLSFGTPATHAFLRNPACGDGILDVGEECDDGNASGGLCCASDCTWPGTATTCMEASESSLEIKDDPEDKRDRLTWKWTGQDPVTQSDLGTPSGSTSYVLCISDSTGDVDRLIASLQIKPGEGWADKGPEGWSFRDKQRLSSGVGKVRLTTTQSGSPTVSLSAKGANIPLRAPFSASEFFDQGPRVTVQLFNNATATCWSAEYTASIENSEEGFRATTP